MGSRAQFLVLPSTLFRLNSKKSAEPTHTYFNFFHPCNSVLLESLVVNALISYLICWVSKHCTLERYVFGFMLFASSQSKLPNGADVNRRAIAVCAPRKLALENSCRRLTARSRQIRNRAPSAMTLEDVGGLKSDAL